MSTQTAIDATRPDELQWLPNLGHEPAIPEGWEFAGVEYANGGRIMLDPSAWAWDFINHKSDLRRYAIRRKRALVISGRLTSVGERFAGIDSGDQQITLGVNVEQACWLGRYVGGQIKLTVEVQ